MKAISISIMIQDFKTCYEPQLIRYVESAGPNRGDIKSALYMYGVSNAARDTIQKGSPGVSGKKINNWKYRGLLPVVDTDHGTIRTLKISHIIGYQDYIVKH
jgi:hypothetical protein